MSKLPTHIKEVSLDDPLLDVEFAVQSARDFRRVVRELAFVMQREEDYALNELQNVLVDPPELTQNYHEYVIERRDDFIETLAGAICVLAQKNIVAVSSKAKIVLDIKEHHSHLTSVTFLGNNHVYGGIGHSFPKLIYELANFYKHADEWDARVWSNDEVKGIGGKQLKGLKRQRDTRIVVQLIGVRRCQPTKLDEPSCGYQPTPVWDALKFFGVSAPSDTEKLADLLDKWADAVLKLCQDVPESKRLLRS